MAADELASRFNQLKGKSDEGGQYGSLEPLARR